MTGHEITPKSRTVPGALTRTRHVSYLCLHIGTPSFLSTVEDKRWLHCHNGDGERDDVCVGPNPDNVVTDSGGLNFLREMRMSMRQDGHAVGRGISFRLELTGYMLCIVNALVVGAMANSCGLSLPFSS